MIGLSTILIVGFVWLIHRRTIASDGLTAMERKNLPREDRDIANLGAEEGRQEHVHQTGHKVMPFDLSKTTHLFTMTETSEPNFSRMERMPSSVEGAPRRKNKVDKGALLRKHRAYETHSRTHLDTDRFRRLNQIHLS